MSDLAPDSGAPGGTNTSSVSGAPAGAAPSSQPAGDPFAELASGQAVFDRGYVESLRREGQRYRSEGQQAADALRQYQQVFGGYDDDDRQVWLDLATTWATDPNRAAQVMQNIAQAVLNPEGGAAGAGVDPTSQPPGADDLGDLTPDQVQQMIAEALGQRDQQEAERRAVEEVYAEVRAGGYDPSTREGLMVLQIAHSETGGDIQQALDAIKAWKQSIVDDYVTGRQNGSHLTPTPANGAVATSQEPIHDLKQARQAADAFIRAQMGASSG